VVTARRAAENGATKSLMAIFGWKQAENYTHAAEPNKLAKGALVLLLPNKLGLGSTSAADAGPSC
jgi:hypothetical protein